MRATSFRGTTGEAPITVEEAQARVLAEVSALDVESVVISEALGRVLREEIRAPYDVPSGDNSAMDGYAVRSDDLAHASEESPAMLRVIEDVAAGQIATRTVERGTTIRIMTGALMPAGADAVAQVEITDGGVDVVRVHESLRVGANVRERGEDMRAGEIVLGSGRVIRAAEIGILASTQQSVVRVGHRPTVAILATGDELVELDQPRTDGRVVNSNSYALAALVSEAGGVPRMMGIVRDSREATVAAIEAALECDFVVSTGGVSVGAYDFVKDALDALGAETKFWRVAMKPGKPVVLSRVRDRLFFGLPGNPVSSMVSFHLFVAPSIRKAAGRIDDVLMPVIAVRITSPLRAAADRRVYHRVRIAAHDGSLIATPMTAQGSGVSTSMLQANGLAMLEPGAADSAAGSLVSTLLIGEIYAAPR